MFGHHCLSHVIRREWARTDLADIDFRVADGAPNADFRSLHQTDVVDQDPAKK
jgi:hypothetical protein